MKKFLMMLFAGILIQASCSRIQYWQTATYIYENQCDEPITISTYCPQIVDGELLPGIDLTFSILPGGQYTIVRRENEGQSTDPLNWRSNHFPPVRDSAVVIKGDIQIINRQWHYDPLYKFSAYQLVELNKGKTTLRFVFTDEFFN